MLIYNLIRDGIRVMLKLNLLFSFFDGVDLTQIKIKKMIKKTLNIKITCITYENNVLRMCKNRSFEINFPLTILKSQNVQHVM